jgi:hypothetical protein
MGIVKNASLNITLCSSVLLLSPSVCRADAINPITNLFIRGNIIPASILTILIIIIEAILLRWWVKPKLGFLFHLGRSTIINLISSAAGSILAAIFYKNVFVWSFSSLVVIPMFVLTLATETPALKLLYRRNGLSWPGAAKASVGINLISYIFVFIFQLLLVLVSLAYADTADSHSLKSWNDTHLLDSESGYIYAVEFAHSNMYSRYVLKQYDIATRKWSIIDPKNERGIDPAVWDMRGNVLACIPRMEDWKNQKLTIRRGPDFTPAIQIQGIIKDVRIAPDLKKIAVLEFDSKAMASKDASLHNFIPGFACRLKIYDSKTGDLLCEAPDLAVDKGLCWTNDSNTVLFTSIREKALLSNQDSAAPGHGRKNAAAEQFPLDIFAFDLPAKAVRTIVEGIDPKIVSSTEEISFLRDKGRNRYEIWRFNGKTGKANLVYGETNGIHISHALSPSGMRYLIQIPYKEPLGEHSFLTVIESSDPSRKLVLQPYSHYDFRWVP